MKKVMQRLFAMALCTLLLTYVMVPANAKGFTDIYNGHPYQDAINYVSDNEIMNGITPTEFAPNNAVTRAMLVTILYRKAGSPNVTVGSTFTDVPATAYYAKAVYWAKAKNITNGTSTTTFSPNQTITREQAMCFLYNYSKVSTTAVNKTGSITGYSDYSSVSGYARNAMAWAVANKVLIITDPNKANLYPKHTMSRVQAAYGITAFGTNVERILLNKDHLRIENSSAYFTSGTPYMTQSHKARLYAFSQNKMGKAGIAFINDKFSANDSGNSNWGGSCFGISAVTILDKLGKIAFNENYGYNTPEMYDISSIKGTSAESAINYYQAVQDYLDLPRTKDFSSELKLCYNARGSSLIRIWWKDGSTEYGHAVVCYKCTKKTDTSYELWIYNPNYLAREKWILDTSGNQTLTRYLASGTVNKTNKLTQINVTADPFSTDTSVFSSKFNDADIDTYKNSDNSGSLAHVLSAGEEPKYDEKTSFLTVDLVGEFTIQNELGETIKWDGQDFSGDMDILNMSAIVNGENRAASMLLQVPISDTFTFESSSNDNEVSFSVIDSYRYARASGKSLGITKIDKNGTFVLDGNHMNFDIAYSGMDSNGELFKMSGTGTHVEIISDRKQISEVRGLDSAPEIDIYDFRGERLETEKADHYDIAVFTGEGESLSEAQ